MIKNYFHSGNEVIDQDILYEFLSYEICNMNNYDSLTYEKLIITGKAIYKGFTVYEEYLKKKNPSW